MESRKNFMVAGDLIIDHAVFVKTHDEPIHPEAVPEKINYTVVSRQSTAGGAANTARILAALYPEGKIYLWGILGDSHWGTFRKILEGSQAMDGVFNDVELRGIQDETSATMNTITRLVFIEQGEYGEQGNMSRVVRFDDTGHIHVSDSRRESLLYHLGRVHEKSRLNSIIINDLDKGCMTPDLVSQVADFANLNDIPLFVDPQHEREKYQNIKGTAILPNLDEWCYLVDEKKTVGWWRNNMSSKSILAEMAERSFHYLGNFQYYIIKCDKDGAVIIAPKPSTRNSYAVYHMKPESSRGGPVKDPLGSGDLMTGVIAAEYDKNHGTPSLLSAFKKANLTVACYREMPYQRMPSRSTVVEQWAKITEAWQPMPAAETTRGLLFLPKEATVLLDKAKTEVPGLVSVDVKFKEQVNHVLGFLRDGFSSSDPCSIILEAPSGSGKTQIAKALKGALGKNLGLVSKEVKLDEITASGFIENLVSGNRKKKNVLLIVDEALKPPNGEVLKNNEIIVPLLNTAHQNRIRFLFIDALFCGSPLCNEIESRCRRFTLRGLEERPEDIAYILGDQMLNMGTAKGIRQLEVKAKVLRALVDKVLSDSKNIRSLGQYVKEIYENAVNSYDNNGTLVVDQSHLPKDFPSYSAQRQFGPVNYAYVRSD